MAEKKENNSEKKGIAAWLELPEAEKKFAAAAMRRQGGNYAHAADALEELSELQLLVGALEELHGLRELFLVSLKKHESCQQLAGLLGFEETEG